MVYCRMAGLAWLKSIFHNEGGRFVISSILNSSITPPAAGGQQVLMAVGHLWMESVPTCQRSRTLSFALSAFTFLNYFCFFLLAYLCLYLSRPLSCLCLYCP